MATVTASIIIQSPNITNDVLSLNLSYNMTVDGTDGVSEIVGVSRRSGVNTRTTLFASSNYANGGIVYIKNLDPVWGNEVLFEVGTGVNAVDVGVLNGGEAYLIPWNGEEEFSVTADEAGTVIEYALFVK
jgi:hypothetical protein